MSGILYDSHESIKFNLTPNEGKSRTTSRAKIHENKGELTTEKHPA